MVAVFVFLETKTAIFFVFKNGFFQINQKVISYIL